MTKEIKAGDIIHARGRDWTAVTAPTDEVDMLVADPHFTEDERRHIGRVETVNEKKKIAMPHNAYVQRAVLDVSEIS